MRVAKAEESEFNLLHLKEKGRLHFFYHSPLSSLPIRDVTDEQGAGCKTEPYVEHHAVNYLNRCNQMSLLKKRSRRK